MKHPLPPLDSLKAFEAAARHLSFSLAADELCITKGAVSYQIRKLEQHLQCTLFKRTVRQVYLTDDGQVLLQTTKSLFAELSNTLRRLQADNLQAAVSIAATTYVAARWLSPRISAFSQSHPNISLLLQHSVNAADFKLTDVDLAIRWGPCSTAAGAKAGRRKPSTKSTKAPHYPIKSDNRIGEIAMPLYPAISPQLLSQYGIADTSSSQATQLLNANFQHLQLLCEDRKQDLWQEWIDACQPKVNEKLANPRRTISDANVRVQAAIDGQGLILADDLMRNEINNDLLRIPFAGELRGYGYVFLAAPCQGYSNNAKTFQNWLTTQL